MKPAHDRQYGRLCAPPRGTHLAPVRTPPIATIRGFSLCLLKCPGQDSNLYPFRERILSRCRGSDRRLALPTGTEKAHIATAFLPNRSDRPRHTTRGDESCSGTHWHQCRTVHIPSRRVFVPVSRPYYRLCAAAIRRIPRWWGEEACMRWPLCDDVLGDWHVECCGAVEAAAGATASTGSHARTQGSIWYTSRQGLLVTAIIGCNQPERSGRKENETLLCEARQ
jgi:hypothetical protein